MPESQVSWKVWIVISIVTAGITPFVMELLPAIASVVSNHWSSSDQCIAVVSHPDLSLKIHQAPTLQSIVSVWAQQGSEAQVTVVGKRQGWYQVSDPENGWVEGDRVTAACLKAF